MNAATGGWVRVTRLLSTCDAASNMIIAPMRCYPQILACDAAVDTDYVCVCVHVFFFDHRFRRATMTGGAHAVRASPRQATNGRTCWTMGNPPLPRQRQPVGSS